MSMNKDDLKMVFTQISLNQKVTKHIICTENSIWHDFLRAALSSNKQNVQVLDVSIPEEKDFLNLLIDDANVGLVLIENANTLSSETIQKFSKNLSKQIDGTKFIFMDRANGNLLNRFQNFNPSCLSKITNMTETE